MSAIVEMLKAKNYFICEHSVTAEDIKNAERSLNLTFADDYTAYVLECGTASYEGHELTGISKDIKLDVVTVTKENLQRTTHIKIPLYVIEETHIDGIVIWQAPDKKIYQTGIDTEPVKIAENLAEYIQSF